MNEARVLILMDGLADLDSMKPCLEILEEFGVDNTVTVASAHRTPHVVERLAREAEGKGTKVIICATGTSAQLAGAVAAYTILPVIGVPRDPEDAHGPDLLASMVQMPSGIPVACVGAGKHGGENAAYQAIQILALQDSSLRDRLYDDRDQLSDKVSAMDRRVQKQLGRE